MFVKNRLYKYKINILLAYIILNSQLLANGLYYDESKKKGVDNYEALVLGKTFAKKPETTTETAVRSLNPTDVNKKDIEKSTQLYTERVPIEKKEESLPFATKQVFAGTPEQENNEVTKEYIKGNIRPEDILMAKEKKDEVTKIKNKQDNNIILNNRTVYYNIEKSLPEVINVLMGYSTDLEVVDDLGNNIPIRGFSTGAKPFTLENPEPNMLSIFPTEKYKETNFTLRMEGYNNPIIFRIMEGNSQLVDTRLKIVLTSNTQTSDFNEVSYKSNILKELLKTGTLNGKTQKDYEIFDIAKRETAYFNKNLMKIFHVEKMGKEYNIILLDKNYEILGEQYANFNRYQNTLNAYFLDANREVFTIMSKVDKIKDSLSFDFIKDIGLVEKYRITIVD